MCGCWFWDRRALGVGLGRLVGKDRMGGEGGALRVGTAEGEVWMRR